MRVKTCGIYSDGGETWQHERTRTGLITHRENASGLVWFGLVLATPLLSQYRPDRMKLNSDERDELSPFVPASTWKIRS